MNNQDISILRAVRESPGITAAAVSSIVGCAPIDVSALTYTRHVKVVNGVGYVLDTAGRDALDEDDARVRREAEDFRRWEITQEQVRKEMALKKGTERRATVSIIVSILSLIVAIVALITARLWPV